MIWNQPFETMPREQLEACQLQRLKDTVERVYHNVPWYRQRMQAKGVTPADIRSLKDLSLLPFTMKQDLRDYYPFGCFAADMSQIVELHASSGTTGKPIVVGYTHHDLAVWSEIMARSLSAAGIGKHDIIQNAYGYGLFTGGMGVHHGGERLGATVLPISGGNTKRQVMLMKDLGVTALTCTPSYALYLAEAAAAAGLESGKDLKLQYGVFGAEPWSEGMRQQLQQRLGIRATDIYGLTEVMGPGVASECEAQNGLHIWEDHFLAEIIDPETGEVLPVGSEGELVFTAITKEGSPFLRYRTRDITRLDDSPCSCGRTHIRMQRIKGRTDDMLIIRGVNVFPSQVETVLGRVAEVTPNYLLVVDRVNNTDTLDILVEMSETLFSDEVRRLEAVRTRIEGELASALGISARVRLVEPGSIERSEGKAKRVQDKRKL